MKTQIKKYAGFALASTIVIGGIASAAITPIPTISNTFAIAGQKILSADLNKLAEALNILDSRTNGTAPTEPNHLADKEYVDSAVAASQSIPWIDVPLTDTNKFDISCEYAFKTEGENGIFVVADTIDEGAIRYQYQRSDRPGYTNFTMGNQTKNSYNLLIFEETATGDPNTTATYTKATKTTGELKKRCH